MCYKTALVSKSSYERKDKKEKIIADTKLSAVLADTIRYVFELT